MVELMRLLPEPTPRGNFIRAGTNEEIVAFTPSPAQLQESMATGAPRRLDPEISEVKDVSAATQSMGTRKSGPSTPDVSIMIFPE